MQTVLQLVLAYNRHPQAVLGLVVRGMIRRRPPQISSRSPRSHFQTGGDCWTGALFIGIVVLHGWFFFHGEEQNASSSAGLCPRLSSGAYLLDPTGGRLLQTSPCDIRRDGFKTHPCPQVAQALQISRAVPKRSTTEGRISITSAKVSEHVPLYCWQFSACSSSFTILHLVSEQ